MGRRAAGEIGCGVRGCVVGARMQSYLRKVADYACADHNKGAPTNPSEGRCKGKLRFRAFGMIGRGRGDSGFGPRHHAS
jgi:hypothetical protein